MSDPLLPVTVILKVIAVTEGERHGVNPSFPVQSGCAGVADLEDFAGICRGNLMILFGISSGLQT
jgi:hypothetical protein